jgi:sulfur carrier protein
MYSTNHRFFTATRFDVSRYLNLKFGMHWNRLDHVKSTHMNVTINGEQQTLGAETSIDCLIEQLGLQGKRLAVEVNLEIVPRSEYGQRDLAEGDVVEIVQAIGGG